MCVCVWVRVRVGKKECAIYRGLKRNARVSIRRKEGHVQSGNMKEKGETPNKCKGEDRERIPHVM